MAEIIVAPNYDNICIVETDRKVQSYQDSELYEEPVPGVRGNGASFSTAKYETIRMWVILLFRFSTFSQGKISQWYVFKVIRLLTLTSIFFCYLPYIIGYYHSISTKHHNQGTVSLLTHLFHLIHRFLGWMAAPQCSKLYQKVSTDPVYNIIIWEA